jgi:hypothetical protein
MPVPKDEKLYAKSARGQTYSTGHQERLHRQDVSEARRYVRERREAEESETVVQREGADVGKKEYPVPSDCQSSKKTPLLWTKSTSKISRRKSNRSNCCERGKSETLRCEGDIMTNTAEI